MNRTESASSPEASPEELGDPFWWTFARLVRIPNTLTSVADVLSGAAIACSTLQPWWGLLALVVGSICFYWAGMAFNDVIDAEEDRLAFRRRPIVDGSLSFESAKRIAWGLLLFGLLCVSCAAIGGWWQSSRLSAFLPMTIALLLALAILAYNSRWKETKIGPIIMGLCRGLNLSLGFSLAFLPSFWERTEIEWWHRLDFLCIALGHVLYITGVTTAARRETEQSRRHQLILGWSIALLGVAAIAAGPALAVGLVPLGLDPFLWFPLLIALLSMHLVRRAFVAIRSLQPGAVQASIKHAILNIIFLDAASVLQYSGTTWGSICCLMILPSMWLGKRFRST